MERTYFNPQFPHFLHGADYNPEQWMENKQIWDTDMCLMKQANFNECSVGIFSWSFLEPREGEFDFSFLDEILEKLHQNGQKVFLATPSGARPHWLADKYPEVLRVNAQRQRYGFGTRHNHCYTSPVYRQKVRRINTLLAQRYGSHPAVLGWHISNEYGGECYCPLCQDAFREYLKKRYHNDISQVNRAWWTGFWSHTYDSFDQIEAPSELTETSVHGLNLDWRRFVSHQSLDFMKSEIEAVKAVTPELPVTTNMMPGHYVLDYHEFAKELDVISWDSYPAWHDGNHLDRAAETAFWHSHFRSMKDQPFLLMESAPGLINWMDVNKLKRPGMDTLASLQAIAHGSDSVQYFQWRKGRGSAEKFHGAVVDHRGTAQTRIFQAVRKTGEILKQIDAVCGSAVCSRVAIVYDWENHWALDDAQAFQKNKKYDETCISYFRPLWDRGISADVVSKDADWKKYDLVILPQLYMTEEKTVQKIKNYVAQGGTAYATYMLGMVNETDLCYLGGFPAEDLKQVFGIWNEEIDSLYPQERLTIAGADGKTYEGVDYAEMIHPEGAQVLARYASEFYAGQPCYTVNSYGKGKAYYQAFRDTGHFKDAALEMILRELGISGAVKDLPAGITAHARYADGVKYLFVENYTENPTDSIDLGAIYTDMLTGESVSTVTVAAYSARILKKKK